MTRDPATRRDDSQARARSGTASLGRIAGVPLEVHWTFAVLLVLVVVADARGGVAGVVSGLAWVIALFACVVVHELAHCVVARSRGATVTRIMLLPIGGVSQLEAMPTEPDDEFAIAAVGPLTSICLSIAFFALAMLAGGALWPPTLFAGGWFTRLAWLNLLLGAFNLVPAIPMDGGRMLRASLARHRDALDATVAAAKVARVAAMGMIVVGLLVDVWLVVIGLFVLLGASAEQRAAYDAAARHPSASDGHVGCEVTSDAGTDNRAHDPAASKGQGGPR